MISSPSSVSRDLLPSEENEKPNSTHPLLSTAPLAYDDRARKDVVLTMFLFLFSAFSSRSPMTERARCAHHTDHLGRHPQSTSTVDRRVIAIIETSCPVRCFLLCVNTRHPQPCLCPRSYILCFDSLDHLDALLFQRHNRFQIFFWLNDRQPARMGFSPKEASQPAATLSTSGGYE